MVAWDKKGRPSKWETITEPEFDVNERDNWFALLEYEEALCPQCKQLRSVCEDRTQSFFAQKHVCWQTAAGQVANRRWQKMNRDAKPDDAGYLATDGVVVWANTDGPDDPFLDAPTPKLPTSEAIDDSRPVKGSID